MSGMYKYSGQCFIYCGSKTLNKWVFNLDLKKLSVSAVQFSGAWKLNVGSGDPDQNQKI